MLSEIPNALFATYDLPVGASGFPRLTVNTCKNPFESQHIRELRRGFDEFDASKTVMRTELAAAAAVPTRHGAAAVPLAARG